MRGWSISRGETYMQ